METWLWAVIGMMAVVSLALFIKIHLLQKSAREIEQAFAERLMTDTNTLIGISTGDKHMRHLANAINRELRTLRAMRHRYEQGDLELKNAVTNISHDLRTPLTAICGYLDLLEQEEKSEAVSRYVEVIRNRAELLAQLTEELFRYSLICSTENHGEKEPASINAILEECIAAFYIALSKRGITPDIQMPKEPIVRTLDRSALSRVFSNLLTNAVKYSDGDLDITLSETGEITFANTASGLDETSTSRLLNRFYTVETARKSTGLGLAIAKTLMEQMGGQIAAEYKEGKLFIHLFLPDKVYQNQCKIPHKAELT